MKKFKISSGVSIKETIIILQNYYLLSSYYIKKERNIINEHRTAGGTTSLTSVYLASNVISGRDTRTGTEAYKVNNDVI